MQVAGVLTSRWESEDLTHPGLISMWLWKGVLIFTNRCIRCEHFAGLPFHQILANPHTPIPEWTT